MNCNQDVTAIATAESLGCGSATRKTFQDDQLNSHLERQVQAIAPELNPPTDPVAARLRLMTRQSVSDAISKGETYWQLRQGFKKLKDFKIWLFQATFRLEGCLATHQALRGIFWIFFRSNWLGKYRGFNGVMPAAI